ncbi:MAG: hypothetical protein JWO89_47 [Verrucomicrobiaceae bacterium]|nr:hypothetical protein [Verrucomicrobiaceae bacterium]
MSQSPPPLPSPSRYRTLGICYLVAAGIWFPLAVVGGFFVTAMIVFTTEVDNPSGAVSETHTLLEDYPAVARLGILGTSLIPTLLMGSSGLCILRSTWRSYVLTVAWLLLLAFPFGTALGVWTLRAMQRRVSCP